MAIVIRAVLKGYFVTGAKPTQQQFADLIDSFLHTTEGDAVSQPYAIPFYRANGTRATNAAKFSFNEAINSLAAGYQSIAGENGIALGFRAKTEGTCSVALGNATAFRDYELVIGGVDGTQENKGIELVLGIHADPPVNRPAGNVQLQPEETIICTILYVDAAGTGAYIKAVISFLNGALAIALLDKLLGAGVADLALADLGGGMLEIRPFMEAGPAAGTIRISGSSITA